MNSISEDNSSFFRHFLKNLREISDLGYQEQFWGKYTKNIIDSFEISAEMFLDDCEIILNSPNEYNLNKKQQNSLNKLYKKIDHYFFSPDGDKKDEEILQDPRWIEIREFAKEVYQELSS